VRSMLAAWAARRAQPQPKPKPAKETAPVVKAAVVEKAARRGAARDDEDETPAAPAPRPRISTAGTPVAAEHETDDGKQFRLPLPGLRKEERVDKSKKGAKPAAANGVPVGAVAQAAASVALAEPPTEPLPPLHLLGMPTQPEDLITAADLTSEANLLVAKLVDFGIDGRVTEIHPGPVVTTFEFEPAAGVKVNQIVSREDDLALTLRAQRIRILAPIPGKGAVGVEIPNRMRRTVYLREVLSSRAYDDSSAALKIPLGVDVVGQPFVTDLTKTPHVLVAGATGSGKSVCLNAIITGLLFQHGPDTLRMLMI